jgi:membrane protein
MKKRIIDPIKELIRMFNILSDDREIGGNLLLWSFIKLFTSHEKVKQASAALTYHTLFALAPVMAMLVAVAKLMGYGELFSSTVEGFFEGQEGIAATLLIFAESYLHNAQVNYWLGAGVGLLFLIYSLFSIFQTIDDSFNSLWNLKGHSLKQQIKVFLLILLVPFVGMILLVMWLSVSSYISSGGVIHEVNVFIIMTSIYVALMFLAYKFIPNTKVEAKYAIRSAIACGIAFGIVQYFGFIIMGLFSSYRNIYGDLASLMLFILWIYFSWTICLVGSRWNYLLQEGKRLDQENKFKAISHNYRKFLTILIIAQCEKKASENKDFFFNNIDIATEMSHKYNMPTHFAMEILEELERKGIIYEDYNEKKYLDSAFIGHTVESLHEKLDDTGENNYAMQMIEIHQGSLEHKLWLFMNNPRHIKLNNFDISLKKLIQEQ